METPNTPDIITSLLSEYEASGGPVRQEVSLIMDLIAEYNALDENASLKEKTQKQEVRARLTAALNSLKITNLARLDAKCDKMSRRTRKIVPRTAYDFGIDMPEAPKEEKPVAPAVTAEPAPAPAVPAEEPSQPAPAAAVEVSAPDEVTEESGPDPKIIAELIDDVFVRIKYVELIESIKINLARGYTVPGSVLTAKAAIEKLAVLTFADQERVLNQFGITNKTIPRKVGQMLFTSPDKLLKLLEQEQN
jgi:hypothetical protein